LVDVGDEIEHVGGVVPHPALGGELRHAQIILLRVTLAECRFPFVGITRRRAPP
jgi:hypothetical protein